MTTRWHKKLVSYSFIAIISIILVSNMFITLWILTAIGFNIEGLGLSSGSQHLQAQGDIFAMKNLYASRILDFDPNGLVIKAFKNLSMVAESERRFSSAMFINEDEVVVATKKFVIMNTNGETVFSTSPKQTSMTAKKMKLSDPGGIQFTSSIETQNIRSGPGNSLTVSSPVGKLKLNGPQKVDFSSFAGPINLFGLEDITLKTKGQGKITLHSGAIRMPRLIQSNRTSSSGGYFRKKSSTIFQLCACADGKLFMSKATALCIADYHICTNQ